MFIFQFAMGAERKASLLASDLSKAANISNIGFDTKIPVVMVDDKVREMTVREFATMLAVELKAKNINPLKALQQFYGGSSDGNKDILQMYSKLYDSASLAVLAKGGTAAFNETYVGIVQSQDIVEAIVLAHVKSKFENCAELPIFGQQDAITDTRASLVVVSSAFLNIGAVMDGASTEFDIKDSKGGSSKTVDITRLGKNRASICARAKKDVQGSVCTLFDLNSQYNTGADKETAFKAVSNIRKTKDPETRATQLFGSKFVETLNTIIENAVDKYISAKISGSESAITSMIINELQMRDTIRSLKDNSESVNDFLEERKKNNDSRGGFT